MKKFLLGIMFSSFLISNINCISNFFLQAPKKIKQLNCSRTIDMCWHGQQGRWTFIYQKDTGVYVTVECKELPEGIDEKTKSLFKYNKENKDDFAYKYTYGTPPKGFYCSGSYFLFPVKLLLKVYNFLCGWFVKGEQKDCYCVEERLTFKDTQDIKSMTTDELACFIKDCNIIFYTGAGISASAGVFTMWQLEEALGMDDKEGLSKKNALYDLHGVSRAYQEFCEAMLYNSPTQAHEALKKIVQYKKCKIVTENLDNLHERTGIEPYTIHGKKFGRNIKNEWACEIEAIICCGLSYDDRGFLGWYKKHNPNGIIIAIDLGKPSYLSENDYLLMGDLQDIIPALYEKISK